MEELYHHGILGQKWGVRNGPPYPLTGGSYSPSEQKKIRAARSKKPNSVYNKKHFDEVLDKDKTTLSTLSYDPDRTKKGDMFYATHTTLDRHQYNALFNSKLPEDSIFDEDGNRIGTSLGLKYRITNKLAKDVKVASEDSAGKQFAKLYAKDRDFYNFVTDETRMQSYFDTSVRYKFKGYRDAEKVLAKMRETDYTPSEKDLITVYRLFNYALPYDGGKTDSRGRKDFAVQRAKFFSAMKEEGYGALLDTNDALYGGFKATSPVIVFDKESIIPSEILETTPESKAASKAILVARKTLGV